MKKCLIILLMTVVMIRFTRQAIGDDREVKRDAVMASKSQQEEKRIKNTKNTLEAEQGGDDAKKEKAAIKQVKVEAEQGGDDAKKEKAAIRQVKIEKVKEEVKTKEAAPRKTTGNFCRFGKIELVGNKVFSYKELEKKVFGKFIGKPLNSTNIKALKKELKDCYISKGYTKTNVGFDSKQIMKIIESKEGGEITFTCIIEEGKIGDIKLEVNKKAGDTKLDVNEKATKSKFVSMVSDFRKRMQIFFAFPFMKQKVFNKKAIGQGVTQMNRLRSYNIKIKEDRPKDESLGNLYTDITVINNQNADNAGVSTGSRTTFLNLSCNNGGSKSTGEEVIGLNISQDNLLSVNDNICINYTETAESLFNKAKKRFWNFLQGVSQVWDVRFI
ncbi:hypothetical protein AGMMS49936_10770 [Endomicrobiia bacterium]|nr:hypothetical protein AGMMS49936_10770 [Endomicrobiia bacterium]